MCHQVNFKCCFETSFSLRRIHYEESTLYIPFRRGDMRHPSEVMEQVYYMQPSNKRPFPAVLDPRNVFVMKVQNGLDVIYTSGNEHLHIEALLLSLLLFWVCLRHPTDVGMGFLAIVSIIQRPRYKTYFWRVQAEIPLGNFHFLKEEITFWAPHKKEINMESWHVSPKTLTLLLWCFDVKSIWCTCPWKSLLQKKVGVIDLYSN